VDFTLSPVFCLIVLWLLSLTTCLLSNHLLSFIYCHLDTIYFHCPLSVIYCLVSSVHFLLTASLLSIGYSLLSAVLCLCTLSFDYYLQSLVVCHLTEYIQCHFYSQFPFFLHSLTFHTLFPFPTASFLPLFISFLL